MTKTFHKITFANAIIRVFITSVTYHPSKLPLEVSFEMTCYIFGIKAWFWDLKGVEYFKEPCVHKYGGPCNIDLSCNMTSVSIILLFL